MADTTDNTDDTGDLEESRKSEGSRKPKEKKPLDSKHISVALPRKHHDFIMSIVRSDAISYNSVRSLIEAMLESLDVRDEIFGIGNQESRDFSKILSDFSAHMENRENRYQRRNRYLEFFLSELIATFCARQYALMSLVKEVPDLKAKLEKYESEYPSLEDEIHTGFEKSLLYTCLSRFPFERDGLSKDEAFKEVFSISDSKSRESFINRSASIRNLETLEESEESPETQT